MLEDVCKPGFDAAFERLRAILQQGETDKKTQYSIEALWDIRRNGFKDFPGVHTVLFAVIIAIPFLVACTFSASRLTYFLFLSSNAHVFSCRRL